MVAGSTSDAVANTKRRRPEPRGLCLIRGGGDLATGVAWRLNRSGFAVVVTELSQPLAVRRTVSLSTAIDDGTVSIEGMVGRRVDTFEQALAVAVEGVASGEIAVLVSPQLPNQVVNAADVVVDARLAKRNLDTTINDAPLVIALGPGFTAGSDCHCVIETKRGSRLGRAIWDGPAAADTGIPGQVQGRGSERVLRSPIAGVVRWVVDIGDVVVEGQKLGRIGDRVVCAPFDGLVRGLIRNGQMVERDYKVGDVDPRPNASFDQISDKALAVGGGVLEAVLSWSIESN